MSFQPLGIVKLVTDGKVEIPPEMMEAAGLKEGSNVEVFASKGTVFIRTVDMFCDICGGNGRTRMFGNKHLCDNCIDDISKVNTNQ